MPHTHPDTVAASGDTRRSILFVLPWSLQEIGGVNEVVRNLAAEAAASGRWHPMLMVADYEALHPRWGEGNKLETVRMRLVPAWLPGQGLHALIAFLLVWPLNLLRVARLLAQLRPESINVHYVGPATLTLLLAARLIPARPRVVLSFHGADIAFFTSRSGCHLRLLRWMVHLADACVCCSHDLIALLRSAIADPVERGTVIHNGIDIERTQKLLTEGRGRAEVTGREYIVNVATFEAKKGQDVLVQAFARVRVQFPGLRLVLAGREGPWLEHVRALVDELRLREHVLILTNLSHPDALRLIADARLFLLCSRREPFGIVLLEAATFNVPVVATSVGGVPEIVADGQTGVLVPSEDVEALAREVVRLLQDRALAARLARGAAERARERFTWQLAFGAYEQQYRRPRSGAVAG